MTILNLAEDAELLLLHDCRGDSMEIVLCVNHGQENEGKNSQET